MVSKKDELRRFAFFQAFVEQDYKDLSWVKNFNNIPKKDIISYIVKNIDKILRCYVKVMSEESLIQLKKIISKQNDIDYDMRKISLSYYMINFLTTFSLGKIEFNKQTEVLKIYMPNEFVIILKKYLNDPKLLSENRRFNKICDYVKAMLDVYGIIPLYKLHELFEKQVFKITSDELMLVIKSKNVFDQIFIPYDYKNEKLICDMDFDNQEDAIKFYKGQKGHYKKYSKQTLETLKNDTYVETLKSYKKFVNYLCRNFNDISENIETIKNLIVLDYMTIAQISKETASRNLKNNINRMFDLSEQEQEKMMILINNIYDEYPKWKKRGNI